jgi:hypothetical protein
MGGRGSGVCEVERGSVRENFHKGERILISLQSVNGERQERTMSEERETIRARFMVHRLKQ